MVLPSGINKASGRQAALELFGVSASSVIGVGDAENDHAFLEICGLPVAVANAVPALKEKAALVTQHSVGAGVTELVDSALRGELDGHIRVEALERDGHQHWTEAVIEAVELLQNVFRFGETVLGGGNAKLIEPLPANCRCVDNRSAYIGAQRLWEDSDLFASACASSWRIHRNVAHI